MNSNYIYLYFAESELWNEELAGSDRVGIAIDPLENVVFCQQNVSRQYSKKSEQVRFRDVNKSRNKNQMSDEGFQCTNCGKSYRWINSLYKHLQLECGKEPQFYCPFCPHRAKRKWNLQTHIRVKHSSMI